jgi:hypothetical protein
MLYNWKVYLEKADADEPRKLLGTIPSDTQAQALDNAAYLFKLPSHDLIVEQVPTGQEENDQAVKCATEQLPLDMPYCEVLTASLYKKTETFGDRPELTVQGVRWYVEVEIKNLNNDETATVLYRVWRSGQEFKATRVTIY